MSGPVRDTGNRVAALQFVPHDFGGASDAPLFVWLHANGCASHSYGPLLRMLAGDWRVVALDLPSHGESPPAEEAKLDLPTLAGALQGALDDLRDRFGPISVVGGHSIGACLWLGCASADFDVAVFVEAAVFPPPGHPAFDEARDLTRSRVERIPMRRREYGNASELARTLAQTPAFAGIAPGPLIEHAEAVLRQRSDGRFELRCPPAHEARLYAAVAGDWAYNAARSFDRPALVIGADPEHPGASWATRMQTTFAARLPRASFRALEGVGHMLPLEAPGRVVEAIVQWREQP